MKDKVGNILEVGDYVEYQGVYGIAVGRIKDLQDPWALDMWDALVEDVKRKMPIAIPCISLQKVDDERAMLYTLERDI